MQFQRDSVMSSTILIYSYTKCGTCRKALKWLESHNIKYKLIDIIENPPSNELIKKTIECLKERKYIFNTSGASYRSIGSEKIKKMSDSECIEALSKDPKLIKRPLLVKVDVYILVGFKEQEWESLFNK